MKSYKPLTILISILLIISCGRGDKPAPKPGLLKAAEISGTIMPVDRGFSQYIAGYTSGIIPASSVIEIRFAPEFAAKAGRQTPAGLFVFNPLIKGKTEWADETTLVFKPSKPLDPGKIYNGEFLIHKLGSVEERLKVFPLRIQTLKKDFTIITGTLVSSAEGDKYVLNGELITSDHIAASEIESCLEARIDSKKLEIKWDHASDLIHSFSIPDLSRTDKKREMVLSWNGSSMGVKQKGSRTIIIPAIGEFTVLDIKKRTGESPGIDIVFSEPPDGSQDLEGLIFLEPYIPFSVSIDNNIVTLVLSYAPQQEVSLNIEPAVKNMKGSGLSSPFSSKLDFASLNPEIRFEGKGVILPSSQNLIFPFRAANLKAVDLKIIKIFENNLPYFLQENDIDRGYYIKRFGRPVYSGRVDLLTGKGTGSWNLYTIDLADYINIEPGVLYKVQLSMRKSYSLYPCTDAGEPSRYEELLDEAQEIRDNYWDDPDNYFDDSNDAIYYSMNFRWEDRNNPCMDAFYSPDKNVSRNILASNLGLIAKKGEDGILHVMVNDLLTALPVNEVQIEVYDYQMQKIVSGNTDQDGSFSLYCPGKPYLVIAKKDRDRNYLKINDGASLSLSSFDVAGNTPEKGIKAFIYGERDVWRPGDSIYLSLFIKDMLKDLPQDHPVQFELINSLEQRVDNQIQRWGGKSLLVFRSGTTPDAITGNYRAQFRIGGATFTKRVRIETIKPNRLRINLTFPSDILGGSDRGATGTLNVKWLNGAVARNLNSSVDYILKHTKTEFEKYSQYIFDDPVADFYTETVNIFNNKIDENGNATIRFHPGDRLNAPGMLNVVFTARVQEQGGDESIIQTTYKYAPYPVFVGINLPALTGKSRMLYTDKNNDVKIVTVDERGRPVRSEVEITVYKLSYRWWWESDDEYLAGYISGRIHNPVIRQKITTREGTGSLTFNINKQDWGRYLIRATTPAGHSTGMIVLIDWPWDYGMKENAEGATLLAVSTDKEKYNPGDEVRLSFPSPENSTAIITLENSTGVINQIRTTTEKGNTGIIFRVTPRMAPNVYAYVTVIQPHSQTINDMPIRLYGIVNISVEDPGTRLDPRISMPDEIRSQRSFEIKVSEAGNKPMTYTLAVVDEGLLDITGYKTPDPWNYFYSREALGVKTWDLYDYVLGAFGGTLDRIFATGGDEAITDRTANKAQRFIPAVKFLGPFNLQQGKTNTHTLTLRRYTGSVRTMVIAGNNVAYGAADKPVFVRDPLMVLVTAPRVICPGEKAALPVTLFIRKENISEINIQAEGNDFIKFTETTKIISSAGQGEKDTEFTFIAGERTGTGKIKVTASGGGETAVYEMDIEVRSPNPPETRAELNLLKPGEQWKTSFKPFGTEGSNSAKIEVSSLPSVNLEKHLDHLLGFPHGCTEQIISAAFPQIWLKDLSDNNATAAKSSVNIKEAISKIISRQMSNGGIAVWPGSYQPDNWITSWAGHFMIEAERNGFNITSGFRQKWTAYQQKIAREWRFDPRYRYTANDQAYRLFTLALAGKPEKGAMNRLRETNDIPQFSRWLLAAAFASTGRNEVAVDLLDVRNITTEPEYYHHYYGSAVRDKAVILYTLTLLKNQEQALPVLKEICDLLNSDSWYSTHSLAWGLFGYMKWVETMPSGSNKPAKISIILNDKKTDKTIGVKEVMTEILDITGGTNSLSVINNSEVPVYATLVKKGTPFISDVSAVEKGLSMKVSYVDMNLNFIDHKNLTMGTDFMMAVRVTNNTFSAVKDIALTRMVPSGWEIRNTRLFEAEYGIRESAYDYTDIRDDRVNTYFSLGVGETKTFILILNAAYKGEFSQPAIWCEAMYTENCYARYPGGRVAVTGE
ncbi:MAG TPA: hypothetical protein DDW27_08385 [Bacteroidales bacterium]|nr:hypothetical protein [Bacteroidales bacterium]